MTHSLNVGPHPGVIPKTLLIMAGGTGGHVMPALAVAEELRTRGHRIIWLGTKAGIEHRLVPLAGFELQTIKVKGLRGTGLKRKLTMPVMLAVAVVQSFLVIIKSRADAILGMGGFVAGPGALVAKLLGKPIVIHEQNAVMGSTNQIVSRFANHVMTGFADVPGLRNASWVGNPVKANIAAIHAPAERLEGRESVLRVLVIGGSQGAQVFNQHLPELFSQWSLDSVELEIRHQSGQDRHQATKEAYDGAGLVVQVFEFIDDMAAAYAWSDVVICRSGAMTVAEVAAAGTVAFFVPFPYAVGDHQTANAKALAEAGAAVSLDQQSFIRGAWLQQLAQLASDRGQLLEMAVKARQQARPNAASDAADICEGLMNA